VIKYPTASERDQYIQELEAKLAELRPLDRDRVEQLQLRADKAEAVLERVGEIRCQICGNPLRCGPGCCVSDRNRPHVYSSADLHAALDGTA